MLIAKKAGVYRMKTRTNEEQKQRVRERIQAKFDEQNYEYYPETEHTETYDNDTFQRVGIYVRVSTDDAHQTMSFELQKKYYEDFVVRHPKWQLTDIYADEGISGTSLKHRDEFNRMIADAKAGKLDLIITKSVSRFARNVVDFLGMVRMLAEHTPRIGVFFEAECIYSLNERSQMALSFQATMAEEESRNKSRSMETSLRMRLDHGLPLTPKLLGYTHDDNGKLIPDPETAYIPKLIFFMYLFGYSTSQIALILTTLGKKTYLGNAKWNASGITQTLKNERYCGDVFTRKTFTPDVISHRSVKNRGERPRSRYLNEHEAIVSRDDFIAVQHMLQNAKYGNKSILPELQVIRDGLLKGYVIINPRWGAFTEDNYRSASTSVYDGEQIGIGELTVEAEKGDFDFSGYEIAQLDLMGTRGFPTVSLENGMLKFNTDCVRKMPEVQFVELLVHPEKCTIAIRPTVSENRHAVCWVVKRAGIPQPRPVPATAFSRVLFSLFGWDPDHKYRLYGTHYKNNDEEAMIFTTSSAVVLIRKNRLEERVDQDSDFRPLAQTRKRIGAVTGNLSHSFGKSFYEEQTATDLVRQTKENWQIRLEGRLCNTGLRLNITPYEELKAFIQEHLGELFGEDDVHGNC